jgi:hypothetical protein
MAKNYEIKNRRFLDNINETIFSIINTEEKAYWLGFLYADGNISKSENKVNGNITYKYNIEISLKESDREHLEKFRTFASIKNKVKVSKTNYKDYKRCRIMVGNKKVWNDLNNIGCTPNKSLTLSFPNLSIFSDNTLIRHFIRGYFDGDGCISYCNKEHNRMMISILGTSEFLKELQNCLPVKKLNKITKEKNHFNLAFSNKTGYDICKYLYENSTIYLDRKYNKYKEYCRLYE